jgi:hypothetical protein
MPARATGPSPLVSFASRTAGIDAKKPRRTDQGFLFARPRKDFAWRLDVGARTLLNASLGTAPILSRVE